MTEVPSDATCPNCGAPRLDRFCQVCGQDNVYARLRARQIVGDLLGGMFGWESRVALTVRGLLRDPGGLVLDFLRGRRVRYVRPARFALMCLALWLVLGRLLDFDPMESSGITIGATNEVAVELRAFLTRHLDLFLYLSLPLRALILKQMFRRQGLDLAEELVLVLYLEGLKFLIAVATFPLVLMGVEGMLPLQRLVALVWFIWAVRRVHAVGWWTAIWRGTLVAFLHAVGTFVLMTAVALPWVLFTR
ncbi:DUF3667 domain-containing protein [Engelhardtia mirabilis]|uniref:DUF3667 domain-containing protein n=1 Tax=Engelhardtia mirabilis TaxID=2528011 RepID=A0A518BJQ3_9BACT|nr:hypothetical protein Pla133_22880 [Planctomycetes bacterium Pla133]QDV01537.1 hypothetical protein Pla86_22880 [Planctomycetes bacterium Pla86]